MSETPHRDADAPEHDDPEGRAAPPENVIVEANGTALDKEDAPKRKKKRKKRAAIESPAEKDAAPENGAPARTDATTEKSATDEATLETKKTADAADDAAEQAEAELLPPGNPMRARGLATLFGGLLSAFVIMAIGTQFRFGVPIASLGILIGTFGVLDLLGTFDDPDERVANSVHVRALAQPLAVLASGVAATWAFITLAVDGRLGFKSSTPSSLSWLNDGRAAAALLIPSAFLVAVVGAYRTLDTLGVYAPPPGEAPRPLLRRHGFWLIVLMTVVYLPLLGSHSLSDPWETHYGEVSREILARNDWISLWWAQDGWFWSKPILDFWLQALAMATFGVRYGADRMLSALSDGRLPWPEWAVRMPIFLFTVVAVYLLYKAISHLFNRRAGFLGGIVLLTMPQFFLITHQTMTDMPFVATMASAMALILLGLNTESDRQVRAYEVDFGFIRLRLSAYHLVLSAFLVCALPQILYLFSRNLEIRLSPFDIRGHVDAFAAGSPGNCTLAGNEACHAAGPVVKGLHPALQALIWLQATALVVYMSWGERRLQRLFFLAAWLCCGLSMMAKGIAGLGLPVLVVLFFLFSTKRWKDLLAMEISAGMLIVFAVALPWFVAMYARHGQPFTDRLIFHDMFKRAFTHVHDTNEGDDVSFRYYVWQLGYAMFPWVGLAPAGLLYWMRRREDRPRAQASVLLVLWFVLTFALFSIMLTKFHHYILPALPAAAMLVGILLDSMLPESLFAPLPEPAAGEEQQAMTAPQMRAVQERVFHVGGIAGGVVAMLVGVALVIRPVLAVEDRRFANIMPALFAKGWLGVLLVLAGAVAIVGSAKYLKPSGSGGEEEAKEGSFQIRFDRAMTGAAALAGAFLVLFVGRDIAANYDGQFSQIRLVHLFTYNYKRPWPPSVNVAPALWAFAVVAAVITASLVIAKWRRYTMIALLSASVGFSLWGLDVYMMKISPHFGQRETSVAYYEAAAHDPGPLVAYQMNWKGENFYTGNHVPAFVSSGKRFTDFVLEQKKRGVKTFYFVTEHGRTGSLKNELDHPRIFDLLTTPELDNKFVLVKAAFE